MPWRKRTRADLCWRPALPIDRSVIAEVLAKTDLVTLIGSHVALRRRGQHFIGLCPFHSERSPSFHVRQDRGFFKCFGCGVGGDAIRFVERIDNLPFPEALAQLAQRAGVVLKEATEYDNKARVFREAIGAANAIAALYFHRTLLNAPEAQAARDYCTQRGLDSAAIEQFRLGFAPDRWDGLVEMLNAAGVEESIALQAGLLKRGQHGVYDFYRNRLMVPTTSVTGEIVAFGGRSLDGSEPKYLNTTTTPIYTKGHMLYGLNYARRSAGIKGALILVEGYLDCIAMHRAGFDYTVASLGTAFTPEQAELLRRYAQHVYLAYDGDAAGQDATEKALVVLDAAGVKARVVVFAAGEDPDSFLRTRGSAALQTLLDNAPRASEYRIDRALTSLDDGFRSPGERAAEMERVILQEPLLERDRLRVRVAERLGVGIDDLRRTIASQPLPTLVRPFWTQRLPVSSMPANREREIMALFVEEPALVAEYRDLILPERLRDAGCRHFYEQLLAHATMESSTDVLVAVSNDDEANKVLLSLVGEERSQAVRFHDGAERRAYLDQVVAKFLREDDERRRRELDKQVDALLLQGVPIPEELVAEQKLIQTRLARVVRAGEK